MSEHQATADKLVKAYIKIRDKRLELEKQIRDLEEQQEVIQTELLTICKDTGTDGLKTQYGTVSRKLNKRYWTSDWDSFVHFLKEQDAFSLLQQRINGTNMDQFLEENPDLHPPGLNADQTQTIVIVKK